MPDEVSAPSSALYPLLRFATSWQAILIAVLAVVLGVHIPTFDYWFYNDDYVPFAEIAEADTSWDYIWRLLLVQDVTPNWRVVPGFVYLLGYKTFGMQPLPYHFVSVGFHLGTCALIFHFLRRTTGHAWPGVLGAVIFGVNPTHVFTVAQITSLNNVLGAFFAIATLVLVYESVRAERRRPLFYALAILSFILAIASNESMAALAPVYALTFLLFDDSDDLVRPKARPGERVLRASWRSAPIVAIGAAALLSFFACGCNEASTDFFGGQNAGRIFFVYLGRIVYPIGLEPPTQIHWPHGIAAAAVLALMAIVAVRGPAAARIGALFMLLATIPYTWVWVFTAPRYTYQATAGFAILAPAVLAALHARFPMAWRPALALAGVPLIAALAAWYSWQTIEQGKPFKQQTDDWEMLVKDVRRVFPDVPPGSRVVIIGGPWTDPIYQFKVMPAIAHVTWNTRVRMYSVPPGSEGAREALEEREPNWLVARYEGDELVVVPP